MAPVRSMQSRIRSCRTDAKSEVLTVYTNLVYTGHVLDGLYGFEWDVHNISHMALHGVTPVEAERRLYAPEIDV